jgi:hypothetical protein
MVSHAGIEAVGHRLSALEAQFSDELARSELKLIALAEAAVAHWHAWWRTPENAARCSIEARLDRKFRVCFPLSANAINHVESALAARLTYSSVAKANARIAFEQALIAQWVLLTAGGEDRLKAQMDYGEYKRRKRFIDGLRELGRADESFARAAHGLSDEQLKGLIGSKPMEPGLPKFDGMCARFAGGGAEELLYDVYSDLSGGVHPSWSLVRAHLRFDAAGDVTGINSFGTGIADVLIGRELALSALWALYSVEVCRSSQPRMNKVAAMGEEVRLPVDLRTSDQRPQDQPTDPSAYWRTAPGPQQ